MKDRDERELDERERELDEELARERAEDRLMDYGGRPTREDVERFMSRPRIAFEPEPERELDRRPLVVAFVVAALVAALLAFAAGARAGTPHDAPNPGATPAAAGATNTESEA